VVAGRSRVNLLRHHFLLGPRLFLNRFSLIFHSLGGVEPSFLAIERNDIVIVLAEVIVTGARHRADDLLLVLHLAFPIDF